MCFSNFKKVFTNIRFKICEKWLVKQESFCFPILSLFSFVLLFTAISFFYVSFSVFKDVLID